MEITTFKVKSRNLLVLTFDHSDLNILSYKVHLMQTQLCWIPESMTYQCTIFQQKNNII
jgi:hypothetical protein